MSQTEKRDEELINLCILAEKLPFLSKFVYHELRCSFDNFEGGKIIPLQVRNFRDIEEFAREDGRNYFVYFINAKGIILAQIPYNGAKIMNLIPPNHGSFFIGWQDKLSYIVFMNPIKKSLSHELTTLQIYQIIYQHKF